MDFYQFWLVSREVRACGMAEVYTPQSRAYLLERTLDRASAPDAAPRKRAVANVWYEGGRPAGGMQTVATPFLYATLSVFGRWDYETAYRAYVLVTLAAYASAVLLFCRALRYPFPDALVLAAIFVALFSPSRSDMNVGNVNRLQLLAMAAFVWLQGRAAPGCLAAGGLLGLLVVFKPNLLPVAGAILFVWLVNGRGRKVWLAGAGVAAGGGLALAAGALYFGSWRCWQEWVAILRDVLAGSQKVEEGNYALTRLLESATGLDMRYGVAGALAVAFAAAAWLGRGRAAHPAVSGEPDPAAAESLLALGLGAALVVLSASLAWVHYYLLLVPLIVFLLRPPGSGGKRSATWGVAAFALLFQTEAIVMLPVPEDNLSRAVVLVSSSLVFAALGMLELVRLGTRQNPCTGRQTLGSGREGDASGARL